MTRLLRLNRDRGAVTLSYVLVFPAFLLGIMTVVQASVWYLARETALAAAQHGADVARTSKPPPGEGAAAAFAFARSAAPGFLTNVSATSRGSTAVTVRITVSGQAPSLVPWKVFKITEVVTAPVERFVALGGGAASWEVPDVRAR
jgi:Flp pilus assembly protein TadG